MLDFGALLFVGGEFRRDPHVALAQIIRVIARVLGQSAARDFHRAACHPIEKIVIMRNQDDPAFVIVEIVFEPVARFDIQMVGRLVEHHEVGALQQQLGEPDPHPDTAGKLGDVAGQIRSREPEPEEHRLGAALGRVEVVTFEFMEHIAEFVQGGVVPRSRGLVREDLFQFEPPLVDGAHLGQRGEGFLEHRTASHLGRVLRQVADTRALRMADAAGIRLDHAGNDFEQRRFASAVEAHEAHAVVVGHRTAHAVKDGAAAKELGDFIEGQHCLSAPIGENNPLSWQNRGVRKRPGSPAHQDGWAKPVASMAA